MAIGTLPRMRLFSILGRCVVDLLLLWIICHLGHPLWWSSSLAASPSMRSISRVALSIFIIRLLAHRDPASSANLLQLISVLSARSSVRPDAIVLVLNAMSSDSSSLSAVFRSQNGFFFCWFLLTLMPHCLHRATQRRILRLLQLAYRT